MRRSLAIAGTGATLVAVVAYIGLLPDPSPEDQPAQWVQSSRWDDPRPWFGGLSGLEVTEDGRQATVISDAGFAACVDIQRSEGRITAIRATRTVVLETPQRTSEDEVLTDAEGLVVTPEGDLIVAFERVHRLQRHAADGTMVGSPIGLEGVAPLDFNSGLEALAQHPDGTIFAVSENVPRRSETLPLHAFDANGWRVAGDLTRTWGFRPVGADFDTTGRLYLLERRLTPFGFQSRVRRISFAGDGLSEAVLMESSPGRHPNLEGIAIWHDGAGTRITMVSDSNYSFLQRMELVEYSLPD